jgi:hypothetical protein
VPSYSGPSALSLNVRLNFEGLESEGLSCAFDGVVGGLELSVIVLVGYFGVRDVIEGRELHRMPV